MPTVKAIQNCYIGGTYHEKGEVFEHNGPANPCVVPCEDPQPKPEPDVHSPPKPRKWWNPMKWFGSGDNA